MTLAYFDCFSGISGDMTLGALVDAGISLDALRLELVKLGLGGYRIEAAKVMRAGIAATQVRVLLDEAKQPARRLEDIKALIAASSLDPALREKGIALFERLARVEAEVHGTTPEAVHFHETGAVDAIVDIMGTLIGLGLLGVTCIACSAINLGSGTVESAHGTLPVPAPATVALLRDIPSYGSAVPQELTTPTGALLMSGLASSFGPLPALRMARIGYGAGGRDIAHRPNVLRLILGEPETAYAEDQTTVIETNIDDLNPQVYDYLLERLIQEGAQDAFLTPIIMKKGRPAVLLSVLAAPAAVDPLIATIFRETSSIGVRINAWDRKKLSREIVLVDTPYGPIRVKVSNRDGEKLTATPEYEDCRRVAQEQGIPLRRVMEVARSRWMQQEAQKSEEEP